MGRRVLWLIKAVFLVSALSAQETPGGEIGQAGGIFPLAPVLEGLEYAADGCKSWRPDWPLSLPPDAFKVRSGEIASASLEGEGFSLNYRTGPSGLPEEFPFMLGGKIAQVSLEYGPLEEIREMAISYPPGGGGAGEAWNLEFLEYRDGAPYLIRGARGADWYFILLSYGGKETVETWYDQDGNILGAYRFSLTEIGRGRRIRALRDLSAPEEVTDTEYFYDSRGFLTETAGPGGLYKTLYYREDLPRYWERLPADDSGAGWETGNFSLEWDGNGLLLRISRIEPGGGAAEPSPPAALVDCRYEYTLDERGNWIERREIRMVRRMGLLVSSPGAALKRVLEYSE